MSEYWKSTPKYWCKFCQTYVKDTKFEKQQHEATGRHIGNVQRSLRGIHREHEREERDKQRAKYEVARLNGIVAGKPPANDNSSSSYQKLERMAAAPRVTIEERKRQMQQLADMGIAIPEPFRGEMAMPGQWETVTMSKEEEDAKSDVRSFGVRKRKLEDDEEEEEAVVAPKRRGWGATFRTHPSGNDEGPEDIEALLKAGAEVDTGADAKTESNPTVEDVPSVKTEESVDAVVTAVDTNAIDSVNATAQEGSPAEPHVVFKKRKHKAPKK